MRNSLISIFSIVFCLNLAAAKKEYVYFNDFNNPGTLPTLCKGGINESKGGVNNSGCVKFSYNNDKQPGMTNIRLDAKKVAGRKIVIRAMIKGKNVCIPKLRYLGPKLMISYVCKDGNRSWPGTIIDRGSYDYKEFSRMIRVPSNVKSINLVIGIQQCAGTVWFDNVGVELIPEKRVSEKFIKPKEKLQKSPKYRGVMISPRRMKNNNWKDMDDLSLWGANLIRYQMSPGNKSMSSKAYLEWVRQEIPHIDKCLEKCRKYGIKMVLDLHKGPGTKKSKIGSNILSWSPDNSNTLIETWKILAKHYKGNNSIYAYDILNEPRESGDKYNPADLSWYVVAPKVAKAIRKIDPDTPIIISPLEWSNPRGFYSLRPYNIPKLIYTVHVYVPHKVTHQGVHNSKIGISYPGDVDGTYWDKKQLRKVLEPVRDFQLKYNVPIFVGEFSCIRWSPGDSAENYIRDCIELFEEYGWDWTYHAFREWDGWSVEHGNDQGDRTIKRTTPRKKLLLKYMNRNKQK